MTWQYRYPQLRHGLVGSWCPSLGSTGALLIDRSNSGNHGVLTSMDPATDWVPSQGRLCLDFDTTNDYVLINQNATFFCSGSPCAITWWENVTDNTRDYPRRWTWTVAGTTDTYQCFRAASDANYTNITFGKGPANNLQTMKSTVCPTVADGVGVWKHWAIVSANPVSMTATDFALYVDGISYTVVNGSDLISATGNRIGATSYDTSRGPNCKMDDLNIFNRKLTQAEIRQLASRRGIIHETERVRRYRGQSGGGGGAAKPVLFHAHYLSQGMR